MKRKIVPFIAFFALFLSLLDIQGVQAQKKKKDKKKPGEPITIYDIDTLVAPLPRQLVYANDKLQKEFPRADAYDGVKDHFIWFGDDTTASEVLTQAIYIDMHHMDTMILNLPIAPADIQTGTQTKIGYLNAAYRLMEKFLNDSKVDPYYYRKLVTNFRGLIIARQEGKVDEFVDSHLNIQTVNNSDLLADYPAARNRVFSAMATQEPRVMIKRLKEFSNEPYADSVIKAAARIMPNEIYNYASSTDPVLGGVVRRSKDPLVQTIVRIASESSAPLKAMPFLSDIYHKKLTIAQVDHITGDEDLYYKNLVRLKLEQQDIAGDTYTEELAYRGLKYVRKINELHESPDAVRFKSIEILSPEELYFLMVYGQDEIYTSSFIKGTFRQMMDRMKPMPGDSLFEKVHYEKFRTFIRMCANYNVLQEFLATVQPGRKNILMQSFIANLEEGPDDKLEDAVDVADAFGSIRDSTLADFLRGEVISNYKRVSDAKSKKGVIVYGLLSTLFQRSNDTSLSTALGLPPINLVPYKKMLGDTNIVFEQFFFYGDEDGKSSFASFLGNFKDGKWKIDDTNKQWIKITSVSGKPILVFANRPLDEPQDEEAQNALQAYLDQNNIHPTFLIHRGHSYHLDGTIDHMTKYSKIVMLGSCGGYHNLGTVLDKSPDAQIISTKQTGAMAINEPIIKAINNELLAGNDINWIAMWQQLDGYFAGKGAINEMYEEYVPPQRNLGAIFIKAYRKISNASADDDQ